MYKRHDVSINYPHPHLINIELIVIDRKRQRVDHIETLIRKKVGRNLFKSFWRYNFLFLTYWSDLEVQPTKSKADYFMRPTFFADVTGLCHNNHHNHHHNLLTWSTFLRGAFTIEVASTDGTRIVLKTKGGGVYMSPELTHPGISLLILI